MENVTDRLEKLELRATNVNNKESGGEDDASSKLWNESHIDDRRMHTNKVDGDLRSTKLKIPKDRVI